MTGWMFFANQDSFGAFIKFFNLCSDSHGVRRSHYRRKIVVNEAQLLLSADLARVIQPLNNSIMAFLWVLRTIRNVYEIADAALALDCRAVDERQQGDRYKPAHIGLFVQNVDSASVKRACRI